RDAHAVVPLAGALEGGGKRAFGVDGGDGEAGRGAADVDDVVRARITKIEVGIGWGDAERAERLGEELQLHLARLLEAGGEQDATALAADRFGLPTDAQGLGCVRALREHLELEAGVAVVDDLEACLASAGAAQADGLGGLGAERQPEL